MKDPILYPTTVAGVIEALELTFGKKWYSDRVVEKILKQNKKWGSRDRSFVAENTYGMVRHWRLLWSIYDKEPVLKRRELYLLFGIWWRYRGYELPDWPKFDGIRELDVQSRLNQLPHSIAVRQSFPDWLDQLASAGLGKEWKAISEALNEPASVVLRVNRLKGTPAEVQQVLGNEGVESRLLKSFPDALELEKRPKLTHLPSFINGLYEVQDAGSQTIAPFLEPEPGDFVIDACAGAGGKTLHLAALMKNQGRILAMDIEPYKLNELQNRAARNGVTIIETTVISPSALKANHEIADRLLLDVPCSGTGVIRRDVDTKWKLQPEHLERTLLIQRDILSRYPNMLKPGGVLVYATCSILKEENEDQVAWFMDQFADHFEFLGDERLNPTAENDGFYMARFKKTTLCAS